MLAILNVASKISPNNSSMNTRDINMIIGYFHKHTKYTDVALHPVSILAIVIYIFPREGFKLEIFDREEILRIASTSMN